MAFPPEKIVRICEWATIENPGLSADQRERLNMAARAWTEQQGLSSIPVSFFGPTGQALRATQFVGVIEIDNVAIEIYPKLDSSLINGDETAPITEGADIIPAMRNLLWMLEVSEHRELVEADTGHLEEAPTTFVDLFAYLLGKNLLGQLTSGVPHNYVSRADDQNVVRGRIRFGEQIARNWNRYDRVTCTWDEFTSNTPVNRLFKAACRILANKVSYNQAARLLTDCLSLLDDVEDVGPSVALRDVQNVRFDRSVDRFRLSFDLALRLLKCTGHALGAGSSNTFVFLIDMNSLFERYVHAALEAHFHTAVVHQQCVGHLLQLTKGRIRQLADYVWNTKTGLWIGDAKYKHLTAGHQSSLRFSELAELDDEHIDAPPVAGQLLNAGDVRQLTVYAELARRNFQQRPGDGVSLALLYPFVGEDSECVPDCAQAWNNSDIWLVPIPVKRQSDASCILKNFTPLQRSGSN